MTVPPPPSPKPATTVVYILRFRLPAGLQIRKRKELGKPTSGHAVNTTYVLDHEMRRRVLKVRAHYRYEAFRTSIPFYGLRLVRESDLPRIEAMVERAEAAFRTLYESWMERLTEPQKEDAPTYNEVFGSTRAVPIPITIDPTRKEGAAMVQAVHDAVANHVYTKLVERLHKLSKRESSELPEKSRRALLDLTEKLAAWNILGSEDVTKTLEEAAKKFAEKNINPVMEDLEVQVKKFSSEGAWVEI